MDRNCGTCGWWTRPKEIAGDGWGVCNCPDVPNGEWGGPNLTWHEWSERCPHWASRTTLHAKDLQAVDEAAAKPAPKALIDAAKAKYGERDD